MTKSLKQFSQVAFSLLFLYFKLGMVPVLILLALTSLTITSALVLRKKHPQYVILLSCLLLLHHPSFISFKLTLFDSSDQATLLFDVCITWLLAKLTSFSIDFIEGHPLDWLTLFNYLFYFPSIFTGPIHLYHLFREKPRQTGTLLIDLVSLARIVLIGLALELALHGLFVNAIASSYIYHLLSKVEGWSFFGLGYIVTVVFYLKYLTLFGFSRELSAINGIDLPPPPTCVSIVARSLLLWKTFDRGLHAWLLTYFYLPLVNKSKVLATGVCFACVALWHSLHPNIVIWASINFLSVILERTLDASYLSNHVNWLLSSPLFALMVISNICFLTDESLAWLFIKRLFIFPIPMVPVLIVMYAGARVSFHQLNYERKSLDSQVQN